MIRAASLGLALLLASGCEQSKTGSGTSASASSSAAAKSEKPASSTGLRRPPRKWPLPTGPRLAIVAGGGLGPIRLGASVETVERQMALKCDEKTEVFCRYVTRACDFHFANGKLIEIVVHRKGRPAGKDLKGAPREFGIFNGALPPKNIVPGMLESAIVGDLPKPTKVEQVSDDLGFGTIKVHHHDGMRLEFDDMGERGIVLGAIVVTQKKK